MRHATPHDLRGQHSSAGPCCRQSKEARRQQINLHARSGILCRSAILTCPSTEQQRLEGKDDDDDDNDSYKQCQYGVLWHDSTTARTWEGGDAGFIAPYRQARLNILAVHEVKLPCSPNRIWKKGWVGSASVKNQQRPMEGE